MLKGLDTSVYPDVRTADLPEELPTPEDKADFIHRICGAMQFGILPELDTLRLLAGWKEVFDRFPLHGMPAYHTLRAVFHWEPVANTVATSLHPPTYLKQDSEEGRTDPCWEMA